MLYQAETIDGGICAVKAACAADEECHGFVFRARDGAGLLGKKIKVTLLEEEWIRDLHVALLRDLLHAEHLHCTIIFAPRRNESN